MTNDSSGDQFAAIARSLSNEEGVTATLDDSVAMALSIIEGCDHAGITLVTRRRNVKTAASTDDVVRRADQLQYETDQGPCLQSLREYETVYAPDLLTEQRWPQWSKRVTDDLGIRSVLSLQLFVGAESLGSLNLYGRKPDAFAAADRVSALALAAHIAVAMIAAQEQEQLDSALVHRTTIAQAQGMLMQRLGITAHQAFGALARVSQARNVKLHLIAADIVKNGIRPELFS